MGKKKKRVGRGGSGKKVARRVDKGSAALANQAKEEVAKPDEPDKPRMPERIREENAGFGVIKAGTAILIILILASGVLLKLFGGEEATRGDKIVGELCESTPECA